MSSCSLCGQEFVPGDDLDSIGGVLMHFECAESSPLMTDGKSVEHERQRADREREREAAAAARRVRKRQALIALYSRGWSLSQIAAELALPLPDVERWVKHIEKSRSWCDAQIGLGVTRCPPERERVQWADYGLARHRSRSLAMKMWPNVAGELADRRANTG